MEVAQLSAKKTMGLNNLRNQARAGGAHALMDIFRTDLSITSVAIKFTDPNYMR